MKKLIRSGSAFLFAIRQDKRLSALSHGGFALLAL
jgi:hypothetical protein